MISINFFPAQMADLCSKKKPMTTNAKTLTDDLTARTQQIIAQLETLQQEPLEALNRRAAPDAWSALECIEHLSLYGDFYLPEIENSIRQSRHKAEPVFKSGLLGNYFAMSMLPKEKLNKMKTFKDKNPIGSRLGKATIERFIEQQKKTLALLEQSKSVSLNRTKTAISISTWIKLKLGDTFRFVIYHNQRHMAQAFRALENAPAGVAAMGLSTD